MAVNIHITIIELNALHTKDRKSGSAGMPRPSSYAVFCLKKQNREAADPVPRRPPKHLPKGHAPPPCPTPGPKPRGSNGTQHWRPTTTRAPPPPGAPHIRTT